MGELPDGVVTFLFTDIEGSTRLLERFGSRLTEAVTRHHALLAEAVTAHRGVVFETVGDAVYAAFAEPAEAVAAAVAVQTAMLAADWGDLGDVRVRVALHRGPVERTGTHYVGPALYRASRVLALAHGGQTLASTDVALSVADCLPDGVMLRSLGRHRLRDLIEPEEVFAVSAVGLSDDFPPLRSLEGRFALLPVPRTSFVGRDADLQRIVALLGGERLVTLTGPGGIGKTRLATEAARVAIDAHRERYLDGAAVVELASVRDAGEAAGAVVGALSLRPLADETPEALLHRWLPGRRLLLVLDNWEHLLDGAPLVSRLLDTTPDLVVLATSRERLRLRGERVVELDGIADPTAALALLADRAGLDQGSLPPGERDALAALCRRLDGMPLAIELAGARLAGRSATELLRRTRTLSDLLRAGPRDLPERQRTLAATIEWSVGLLEPDERVLFERLGVFTGDATADAVDHVCGPLPGDTPVFDVLEALTERSLLRGPAPGSDRYGMLGPVREAAAARLAGSGDERRVRDRHLAWAVAEAEAFESALDAPHAAAWVVRLDASFPDIAAAHEHALVTDDRVSAARIAASMWRLGRLRSRHQATVAGWTNAARNDGHLLDPWLRARVLLGDAAVRQQQSDGAAGLASITEARALLEPLGPSGLLAEVLFTEEYLRSSFTDDPLEERLAILEQALHVAADAGDDARLAAALVNHVATLLDAGVLDFDPGALERANVIAQRLGNPDVTYGVMSTWTEYHLLRGDIPEAIERATAMIAGRTSGEDRSDVYDVEHLALIAETLCAAGDPASAARMAGAARLIADRSGLGGQEVRLTLDRAWDRVQASIGDRAQVLAMDGAMLSNDEAFEQARRVLQEAAMPPGLAGGIAIPGARGQQRR